MGTNMAPEYANLYLADKERKFINILLARWQCLYFRYLDDICLLVPRHKLHHVTEFIESRLDRPLLQINWERPRHRQHYLDLEIWITPQNTINYEMYHKPTNMYEYVPWSSFHPLSTKRGLVIGETRRVLHRCKEKKAKEKHLRILRINLRKRGYPPQVCHSWILQGVRLTQTKHRHENTRRKEQAKTFRLHVKYHPIWETEQARRLRSKLNSAVSKYLSQKRIVYSKSRVHNLQDRFNKTNKELINNDPPETITSLRRLKKRTMDETLTDKEISNSMYAHDHGHGKRIHTPEHTLDNS